MRRNTLCAGLAGALIAVLPLVPAAAATPTPPPTPKHPTLINRPQSVTTDFYLAPFNQPPKGPPIRSFIIDAVPGQPISNALAVINPNQTPISATLTSSDGITQRQGGGYTFYDDPRHQRTIGSWLHIGSPTVVVPPHTVQRVALTVSIPSYVRPGQYMGSINGTDLHTLGGVSGKADMNVALRLRILVFVRVVGRATAGLHIATAKVTRSSKHTVLEILYKNTGTVIDDGIRTTVTFTRAGAGVAHTLRLRFGTILSGDYSGAGYAIERTVAPGVYNLSITTNYIVKLAPGTPITTMHTSWSGAVTVPKS